MRLRREVAVVGVFWLLGLGAIAAVLVLQARVDQRRRAQVTVAAIRLQVSVLPKTALGLNGFSGGSQSALAAAEARVIATARSLDGLSGNRSDSQLIVRDTSMLFVPLARAHAIAEAGDLRAATLRLGLALLPGGPGYRLNQAFDAIGARYGQEAASARRLSDVGSSSAIVLLLLAFSLTLWRASRLAREKHVLLEQSRRDALTDDLTGLANRRKLFADLEELLARDPRERRGMVGVLDLDGFKTYNDRYGHPAGDELLTRMAGALRAALGGAGVAYRMGGDEFCVLVRGDAAGEVLERARTALTDPSGGLGISCSLGRARIGADGATADELIRRADERLYAEKRLSRLPSFQDVDARAATSYRETDVRRPAASSAGMPPRISSTRR